MAWTRAGQMGMEHGTVKEWVLNGGAQSSVSSTKAHTGTYSARTSGNDSPFGKTFTAASQFRCGVWLNHNTPSSGREPWVISWTGASGTDRVQWDETSELLELYIDGAVVDSVAETTGGFSTTDSWQHCGIVVDCDASSGWASFYLNGTKILGGTSLDTGTTVSAVYVAGYTTSLGWAGFAYFDDYFVDTSDGSEVDSFVPLKIFDFRIANANGTSSDMEGSDGNQVDNYQMVDDIPPDDDTTYVFAIATGVTDSYNTSALAVPAGHTIAAEIPSVLAKKTGAAEQLKVGFYDGATTDLSAAKDLTADYTAIWERFTSQPDATDWNEVDGDAMEIVIESDGTF